MACTAIKTYIVDNSHFREETSLEKRRFEKIESKSMIAITPLAAEKVREISEAEGLAEQGLRLRVVGGGCAGFQYDLYFEESPTEFDERFESNGVHLFIDPLSYQYLDGTEIDYVEGAHGSGFKFGNPNVSGSCGCGSSFQV